MKRVVFLALLLSALGLFTWTLRRFGRQIASGRPIDLGGRTGERMASVLTYFFGQKKVVEKAVIPAARWQRLVTAVGSKYHFLIFWGFLVITLGTAETLIQGLFPSFSLAMLLPDSVGRGLWAVMDVANLIVLGMIAFAVFRRVVLKPRLIPMSRDAAAILGGIATLMATHLAIHALRGVAAGAREPGFPVSGAIGAWWQAGISPQAAGAMAEAQYDIPPDAWYFAAEQQLRMPFAILLEAALQPCGWFANFVGSPLQSETDMLFRNLDGTGTLLQEVLPASGVFRTQVKLLSISQSAGMIIE